MILLLQYIQLPTTQIKRRNMTEQELTYTDIFLLAAEHIDNTKRKAQTTFKSGVAYECFFNENNQRVVTNPLKPSAIERAFIINKFLKKTRNSMMPLGASDYRSDKFESSSALS